MEANSNDAFGAGIEAPADDPFAGAEAEFEQGEDPLAGAEGDIAEQPPVVDKEGNRVNGETHVSSQELPPETPTSQGLPPAPSQLPDPTLPAEDSKAREQREATEAQVRREAEQLTEAMLGEPESAVVPPVAAEGTSSEEPGEAVGSDPDPTTGSMSTGAHAPMNGEPEMNGDGEPEVVKDKKGNVTHRRYLILRPDGDGVWREVHWYEKDGAIVKQGTPGARKVKDAMARGQNEALAIAFSAVGAPAEGTKIVAVARTYFQLRHIEPDPVPPTRQKLRVR